jgi:hypothetical protein
LFVVGTPLLIGFSKGYRLDDAFALIQTGGIYLHSDISNTTVFLNDDFVENNGAFLKNTLIQDLIPNRYYSVRVERENYQNWQKILFVKPNLVTEAKILMLPKDFKWRFVHPTTTLTVINKNKDLEKEVVNPEFAKIQDYFSNTRDQFSIDIATSTYEYIRGKRYPTTTIVSEIRFPDWLSDLASSSNLKDKEMVRERDGIVAWIENGDLFATWAKREDTKPYFFCMEKCKDKLSINWSEPILRYDFYPNRNDVVILLTERGVYAVELDNRSQRNIQTILEQKDLDFRLNSDGALIIFDGVNYRITSL